LKALLITLVLFIVVSICSIKLTTNKVSDPIENKVSDPNFIQQLIAEVDKYQPPNDTTCTQNGYQFKTSEINPDSSIWAVYRNNKDGQWEELFRDEVGQRFRFEDFNKDGFNDIVSSWRFGENVRFFNPNTNNFENSYSFADVTKINDKVSFDSYSLQNYEESTLFTVKNYKKVTYAELEFRMDVSSQVDIYRGERTEKNSLIKTLKLKEFDDFSVETYWNKNWQTFVKD
jgi:hypothetical protein